jgi:hypothetical protein
VVALLVVIEAGVRHEHQPCQSVRSAPGVQRTDPDTRPDGSWMPQRVDSGGASRFTPSIAAGGCGWPLLRVGLLHP